LGFGVLGFGPKPQNPNPQSPIPIYFEKKNKKIKYIIFLIILFNIN